MNKKKDILSSCNGLKALSTKSLALILLLFTSSTVIGSSSDINFQDELNLSKVRFTDLPSELVLEIAKHLPQKKRTRQHESYVK